MEEYRVYEVCRYDQTNDNKQLDSKGSVGGGVRGEMRYLDPR